MRRASFELLGNPKPQLIRNVFEHPCKGRGLSARAAAGTLKASKWGRCPKCLNPLRVHMLRSGPRQDQLALMCSKWFSAGGEGRCWGSKSFPKERYEDLSKSHKRMCQNVKTQLWLQRG